MQGRGMQGGNNSFGQVLSQIGEFASGLTLKQRMLLLGGAIAVAATLFIFVRILAKPEFKPLFTGMAPEEAQSLGNKLAAKSIAFQISPDGTSISVPADKLDNSRLELASGGMPRSARLGFELFDKTNWGGSDFSEKVNYQRALEGELERTIQTLSAVEAARVHLAVPERSVFAERDRETKAAVILKLRSGQLSRAEHDTIASLVSSAVDDLRPENVTVVDTESGSTFTDADVNPSGSDLERVLAERLIKTLEPVAGAARVRSTVRVEYDPSSSEESEEKYDPNAVVTLAAQRTEEHNGGVSAAGVPGTASNVPGKSGAQITKPVNDGATSLIENNTYAVNKLTRRTMMPAGRIRRIAAALLVDDAVDTKQENGKQVESRRRRTPDELKQIEDIAKAAIGFDAARGDIISVQNLTFAREPVEAPVAASAVQKVRTTLNDWSGVVRYFVIVCLFGTVYWFLLRPMKKQALLAFREVPSRLATAAKKSTAATVSAPIENVTPELLADTPEAKQTLALKRHVMDKVKSEPASASRLVQSWLREGVQ
jgi:flagellar M-ring protein FliF